MLQCEEAISKEKKKAWRDAQWPEALAEKLEDLSLIPRFHKVFQARREASIKALDNEQAGPERFLRYR